MSPTSRPSHFLFCAFLVLSASAAERAEDSWPQFRGNPALSGVASAALPPELKVLWKIETADAIESSAAIAGDAVYVGSNDGILHAFDFLSGKSVWAYKADAAFKASPGYRGGRVFAGDASGIFHAVDAATGKLVWKFQTEAEILSSANFAQESVLFGSYDGFLYCLRASDGRELWKFKSEGNVHATPSVTAEHALISGCDGKLRVLRLSDGQEARCAELGSPCGVSPGIAGSQAFAGTFAGHILGFDWQHGKTLWEHQDPERPFPFLSSPAVHSGRIVMGGRDKRVYALEADTGKLLWIFEARGRVDSSPAIAGDDVLIGSHDGRLYRIDLETGKERWRFEAGGAISASPAVARGRLVVGTEDGSLYCFGADEK
ncbi:MAG: PQQ-binding-like beta-propeller repeat protein [Planctomycetes bacterium]|nr:PQQ-binding-like beta-propeller repeat protein [Planctomycetota bacterium]